MSFFESLEIVKNYKKWLHSLDETRRLTAKSNRFTGPENTQGELPDYALAFINELLKRSNIQSHLDPFSSIYSPGMIFDLGETTFYFSNETKGLFAKESFTGRSANIVIGDSALLLDEVSREFDLITSFPPFGLRISSTERQLLKPSLPELKDKSHFIIYKSLQLLSSDGLAIYVVPNGFFIDGKMESLLNKEGFHIDGIFPMPSGALNHTSIESSLIVIKRGSEEFSFYAELSSDLSTLHETVASYVARKVGSTVSKIDNGTFKGAASLKLTRQIEALETQYKSYSLHTLGDISSMRICRTGSHFEDSKNCVYVPKIGTLDSIEDLSSASMKHHNYIQLSLDSTIVLSGYMQSFFRSVMGRQLLNSRRLGHISSLSLSTLRTISVPIPSLSEQRDIIATMEKLSKLKAKLNEFEGELSVNPTSSVAVLEKLDNLIDVLEGLTAADQIRALARNGESTLLEFKETLSWNIRSKEKDQAMEISSLKTIVGFLNAQGGTLLIGVADDGSIPGVNFEVEKLHKNNIDKFQTGFKNLLKDRIGEQFYPYFHVSIESVDCSYVVRVDCEPSSPCFLINPKTKQEEFYVRAPAATDKLEGRKLIEYIEHHWPS